MYVCVQDQSIYLFINMVPFGLEKPVVGHPAGAMHERPGPPFHFQAHRKRKGSTVKLASHMRGTLLCHPQMRFKARPYENEHEIRRTM
jgi:hypothetical protein